MKTLYAPQEDMAVVERQPDETLAPADEASTITDDFHERRSQAIAAKAREIEKVGLNLFDSVFLNFYGIL